MGSCPLGNSLVLIVEGWHAFIPCSAAAQCRRQVGLKQVRPLKPVPKTSVQSKPKNEK